MIHKVGAILLLGLASCGDHDDGTRAAMARATSFLWQQQAEDGGWHSEQYGLLRSGQSLTAFVLDTLADLPGTAERADAVERAVDFLRRHTDDKGCLGVHDELVPDYPNYGTALAARALGVLGVGEDLRARMLAYLEDQQFREAGGWMPDHPAHGGWGMGGLPRQAPHHGHLDLSMSRYVMEALADTGDAALRARALVFLNRCQNPDGGFLFSPVPELAGSNKAGPDGDGWKSYGTTTADGILAMLAMGLPADDPRVSLAAAWLTRRHRTDRVPGFAEERPGGWAAGLHYYYLAASSRALSRLGLEEAPAGVDWRATLQDATLQLQASNGSWRSWTSLVKEDEPLIATCLALRALAASVR